MPKKDKQPKTPVENHITAPLSEIDRSKHVSQVTIPSEERIEDAKEYVDSNEK
ncbi:MAG: DUF3787 domain-containing protein [Clostridium sp.]|nr:DUF3787 domain-containing protein [Clostridium sp.]